MNRTALGKPLGTCLWAGLAASLWVALWMPQAAAEVRATVEPRVIDELDTARLTVRASGTHQTGGLDLEALEADFEVLTTQSSSQYRSVNGRVESSLEYQIMLRPRRAGELTIPPIHVGGEASAPLQLQVRPIEAELKDAIDRMVFFETEVTTNPVYVQAETVLVRRLYYASGVQIYSDLPGMPEITDAVVMGLGDTTSATTVRDGQRYGVIEQRFAIFPEQSGTLTIPAISVTSSVRLRQNLQSGGRSRRSGVRIATDSISLQVLPIPAEYPSGHPWLPARNLIITDAWSPSRARFEVGDPITRTLRATVTGNVSSAIPPLDPKLQASRFRRYPEPPELDNDISAGTLRGHRQQTYAIIPTAPGAVTLPPTELVWWDVNAHRTRTARAPAMELRITATAELAAGALPRAETSIEEATATSGDEVRAASEEAPGSAAAGRQIPWLVALAAAVLGLGVVLLRAAGRRTASAAALQVTEPAAAPRVQGERACWQALKSACAGGDQADMHRALLAYLRAHFATPLPEATDRFRDAGHGYLLERLNAGLYRPDPRSTVSGRELLEAVRLLRKEHRVQRRHDPLPALYSLYP